MRRGKLAAFPVAGRHEREIGAVLRCGCVSIAGQLGGPRGAKGAAGTPGLACKRRLSGRTGSRGLFCPAVHARGAVSFSLLTGNPPQPRNHSPRRLTSLSQTSVSSAQLRGAAVLDCMSSRYVDRRIP